jgi:hypothetical protein
VIPTIYNLRGGYKMKTKKEIRKALKLSTGGCLQISSHGCGEYSVQRFVYKDGKHVLVQDVSCTGKDLGV